MVGISFCLIIVRLGQIVPEARDETWHTSAHSPSSRTYASGRVAVAFPQVVIQQDVYVSDSKDFPMETLGSQKQEYGASSEDLSKVFQPCVPSSETTPT